MDYKLKFIFVIMFVCIVVPYSSFACITLEEENTIFGNTTLCSGEYKIMSPIEMTSNSVLNCDFSEIDGLNSNDIIQIANNKNVTVKNCKIKNSERGINIVDSSNVYIINNEISSINEIGLSMYNVLDSEIRENVFMNLNNGVYIDDYYNITYNFLNEFINNTDINLSISNQKESRGEENTNTNTDYVNPLITEIPKPKPLPENATDTDLPIAVKPIENNTAIKTNETDEKIYEYNYTIYDKTTSVIDDIINEDEFIKEYFGVRNASELKILHEKTAKYTHSIKTVCIKDGNAEVITQIEIKKDFKPLVIYEHIPKNLAKDVSDLEFDEDNYPYRTIKSDPLIMWYFPEVKEGDLVTKTYKIRDVDSYEDFRSYDDDLTTREECNSKVCDNINEPSTIIFEVQEPMSVVVGKEQTGTIRMIYLLFPITIIPIVIFFYIYIPRSLKR